MIAPALPASVEARFPEVDAAVLRTPAGRSLLIGRVLEEGDRRELRWLAGEVGEAALEAWVTRRAGRRLSVRSERFWRLVLGLSPAAPRAAEPVWPG